MVKQTAFAFGLAVLALGCSVHNPDFCPGDVDNAGECIPDTGPMCFGVAPFRFCLDELPTEPRVAITRIDTTGGCDQMIMLGRELCLVMGTDVTISQTVPVTGSRPLVLLASNTLSIEATGIIDATPTTAPGPGTDLACRTGMNGTNGGGGGGGGGGSFTMSGAPGGNGGGGGTAGSAAMPVERPGALQGGCSGTDGGNGGAASHGVRGFGGGGVYLVAGETLAISGTVNASGGGGHGGSPSKGGGGGGGSGGMIVLYAPTVTVMTDAKIFANGGGGGAGASSVAGGDGSVPDTPAIPAGGGVGAGAGGTGGYLQMPPKPGGVQGGDGGGGGGGSVGVIYVLGGGNVSAAQVSPPPT